MTRLGPPRLRRPPRLSRGRGPARRRGGAGPPLPDARPSSPTDADPARNAPYRDDEYGGLRTFPFASVELCLLAVHPSLVALARTLLRTDDVRIYSAEAWAKYTGAARYEQAHHRDFSNHTVVVPSDDPAYRNLELFVFLHEVGEDLGPTHVVSTTRTEDLALLPHVTTRAERTRSSTTPRSPRPGRRGRSLPTAARPAPGDRAHPRPPAPATPCTAASARRPTSGWAVRVGRPLLRPLVGAVRQPGLGRAARALRVPAPGHPFWTPRTLAALEVRYPGLDTAPWRADDGELEV